VQRSSRADSVARRRRRAAGFRPGLLSLEARQLLSATDFMGPTVPMEALNVQLQTGSSANLDQVMPLLYANGAIVQSTQIPGLYTVNEPLPMISGVTQQLATNPAVQFAAPVQTFQEATVPNDPHYTDGSEWQLNGTWGINAPTAWNTTTGSNSVIVADVDTGIAYNHPDLYDNVWLNQAEIPSSVLPNLTDVNGDGIISFTDLNYPVNQGPGKISDTNGDGIITATDVLARTRSGGWASGSTQDGDTSHPDDFIGWNFVNNNNNPTDGNGHGTFTAGEIGAVGNNAVGVAGVNWNTQIMTAQFLNSSGSGTDTAAAQAIDYAVNHGAKVINASWGAAGWDSTIGNAINYANQHGVIIVAAAGNSSMNITTSPFSPASYSQTYPNVIAVAATDSNGALASWSDFGTGTVQLAAPGVNDYGTFPSGYGTDSGTSMAAPLVTGTVALVEAAHPSWSMQQVVDAVVDHTTPDSNLTGWVTTGGLLNAASAVANTDGAYVVTSTPNGSGTSSSPLSAVQVTFNEEINPATFTASQVSLTGPNGTISGITVAAVSGSNNHKFTISFPSQTGGGTYTLTVGPSIQDWYGNSMDQNRNGINGETNDQYVETIPGAAASATFLKKDSSTEGSWIGAYGSQGYNVIGDTTSYPSYATVTSSGASSWTWSGSTTDPRALQNPGGSGRIAACWYDSSSLSINVNLTDGQAHDIGIYALDWDNQGRSEQIQISDANSGSVLDTETLSSFSTGDYLQWKVTGNVVINVTRTGGMNAVISGLFFDPPGTPPPTATASFVKKDTTTEGNWIGAYGSQGYNVIANATSYPAYATVTPAGQSSWTWAASSTDPRALQTASASSRIAACWYSSTSFSINVNLTDGQAHDIALYALDWDSQGRSEQIQITDAGTGTVLNTETVSQFSSGDYLQWNISGHIVITVTNQAGMNAVVSGLFFDPPTSPPPSTATASFIKSDTTTQGNWIGAYGSQGYNVIGDTASYPAYATVTPSGQTSYTWTATTTDSRALKNPGGTGRIAACWYSSTSFSINVNLTDGQAHNIALYCLDWDSSARSEQIQISDAGTGAVLDTESVSSFHGGAYMQWKITGNVVFAVTKQAGMNAVISGLFFDQASSTSTSASIPLVTSSVAAQPVGSLASDFPETVEFGSLPSIDTDNQTLLPTSYSVLAGNLNSPSYPAAPVPDGGWSTGGSRFRQFVVDVGLWDRQGAPRTGSILA
jgi:subtilisin family serine protease